LKQDIYTKFVLTIIALALVCLCIEHAMSPTSIHAENKYVVPTVIDTNNKIAVPVVIYGASNQSGYLTFTMKP
jgi:hypothetical protein